MRYRGAWTSALLGCHFVLAAHAAAQDRMKLIGRWLGPRAAPVATYAGSMVVLRFKNSSRLSADLTVANTNFGQELFIAVTVDGGKPVRMGLSRGSHPALALATGLSRGVHRVTVRKEGEPYFGALQVANPQLDRDGAWLPIADDRPIIEVIGDSDATGICALGPDSPERAVSIYTSNWASETASWVGLLEAGLAAIGHPAAVVNLAMSGSTTRSEAAAYDLTAPGYSDAKFIDDPRPVHASVVFMWGGGNDRHGGGDTARSLPVTYAALSPFQKGAYDLLTKIFERNPGVEVVLLEYIDATIPDWQPAYDQLQSLFPADERERISFLRVRDLAGESDACEIDPKGHPNVSQHMSWAAQILRWISLNDKLQRWGFPASETWTVDEDQAAASARGGSVLRGPTARAAAQ